MRESFRLRQSNGIDSGKTGTGKSLEIRDILGCEPTLERDVPQSIGRCIKSKGRSVVVLAQMAKEYVPEPRMPYSSDSFGALVISEMAVPAGDPHPKFVRVRAAEQHRRVVVGLDHHRIRPGGIADSLFRHSAGICHQEEASAMPSDEIAYSLRGIVRDLETVDLRIILHGIIQAGQDRFRHSFF